MREFKVLGTGCAKCEALMKVARAVADTLGEPYTLEKITDLRQFTAYGVLLTPALVVDGRVVVAGKVPTADELRAALR